MHHRIGNEYLEAKVLTAPPHKLHLMLIDAALHHAQRASDHWDDPDRLVERDAALHRVIAITGELLAGVRGCQLDFADKLVAVYNFIFRRVTEAKIHEDASRLKEAIRILRLERHTWDTVCSREDIPAGGHALPGPHVATGSVESGFSLQA